jgi:hypothetical protein
VAQIGPSLLKLGISGRVVATRCVFRRRGHRVRGTPDPGHAPPAQGRTLQTTARPPRHRHRKSHDRQCLRRRSEHFERMTCTLLTTSRVHFNRSWTHAVTSFTKSHPSSRRPERHAYVTDPARPRPCVFNKLTPQEPRSAECRVTALFSTVAI